MLLGVVVAVASACGGDTHDAPSGVGGAGAAAQGGEAGAATGGEAGSGGAGVGGLGGAGGGGCQSDLLPEPGRVIINYGAVRGIAQGSTYAYKGIPYAAPPVGSRRFRPPEAPACWQGERDATSFGPRCWQKPLGQPISGDEDCLNLNVWAPASAPSSPRTVMVYIHGGTNLSGSSSSGGDDDPLFDGQPYVEQADVVFVSINYRVGILGFMAHSALTAEDANGSSGNYGLLDQIAALQWVHDNIAAFGGNPDDVMVFGESAGAIDTCALMASPLASGLFSRALMESGDCVSQPLATREQLGDSLAADLGCAAAADVAACLRAADPVDIVNAQLVPETQVYGLEKLPFGPTVDGYVLTSDPLDALEAGQQPRALVVGSNADETKPIIPLVVTQNYLQQHAQDAFGNDAPAVLAIYNAANYGTNRAAAIALSTDVNFTCPARRIARAAKQHHPDVYRYHFTHALDGGALQALGAFHALELFFVFQQGAVEGYSMSADELALSQAMFGYWSSFAITSDPNGPNLPTWPVYDAASDAVGLLDTPAPVAGQDVGGAGCDLLDTLAP